MLPKNIITQENSIAGATDWQLTRVQKITQNALDHVLHKSTFRDKL